MISSIRTLTITPGGSSSSLSSYWTPQKLEQRYKALQFGAVIAFMLPTFTDSQWGTVNAHVSGNEFNPIDLDIDEWLDACVAAGMKYVTMYTQHHDGFCLWNTDTKVDANNPYSVEYSTWGIANGTPDIVGLVVEGCRTRGLKPCLYWSIWDAEWERLTGTDETTNAAGLIAFKKEQLTELLTRYGEIYAIWIDGWSWHIPYTAVPYATIHDHIKSLQKKCLVINNDHSYALNTTEIAVWEEPWEYIPTNNILAAEVYKSSRVDNKGTFDTTLTQTAADFLTANEVRIRRYLNNSYNASFLLGITPDNTGHLATAQLAMLNSIGTLISNAIDVDQFKDTDGVRLNAHTPDKGGAWIEHLGTWVFTGNKIHSTTIGAMSEATKDSGESDVDISVDIIMPVEDNYIACVYLRYISATEHWRIVLERDGGGVPRIDLNEYSTMKAQDLVIPHEAGVTRTLRITAVNETITVYWNGVQKIQYTSATLWKTAMRHGIAIWRDATYKDVLFDNYLVESI